MNSEPRPLGPIRPGAAGASLSAEHLALAYDGPVIVPDLTTEIPNGQITVIVGANACGKSTLLRALGRLLRPRGGSVILNGADIQSQPTKAVARELGLLPQAPRAPEGVTVEDLVRRGRYPHQRMFDQWSSTDAAAVDRALALTDIEPLRRRTLDELSGGQRQRAWIAMALAQDTDIMLLDEPTTYLDISHQMDVLDLLADLNESEGRTVVMVLHDLNQACRYAHHLIAMAEGEIVASGSPGAIVDAELIRTVFGIACEVVPDPVTGTPLCVPGDRAGRRTDRA